MTTDQLMDFQRATVDYVLRRLYDDGPEATDRFLVADEVGMGKTMVARGVIAGAIERLENDAAVDRIDVVYICSNADIARQNVAKLDVIGDRTRPLSTRISLLATQVRDLDRPPPPNRAKTVNLIALTPGTSFSTGQATGKVEERALLYHALRRRGVVGSSDEALQRVLQGNESEVGQQRWAYEVSKLDLSDHRPDDAIVAEFQRALAHSDLVNELASVASRCTPEAIPSELLQERSALVKALRHTMSRSSIAALEPDLIVLDEFQRFKHLLQHPDEGEETEVSRLAAELFTYPGAKVLLLSATPYKPLTLAEEEQLTGDNHYKDLLATVRFLAHPNGPSVEAEAQGALARYRDQLVTGSGAHSAKHDVERTLLRFMSRTERPTLGEAQMLTERTGGVSAPDAEDLVELVGLKGLARQVEAQLSLDYWKSSPYFMSFMDGYQLSSRVKARLDDPAVVTAVRDVRSVRRSDVDSMRPIEHGNGRLRALVADTIDTGLWNLLWLPPSMPYYSPGGVYRDVDAIHATKRLIFSSWAAAPSAIAALTSHEAQRRMVGGRVGDPTPRLTYDASSGRAAGMTALALTVPIPQLAAEVDPLDLARADADVVMPTEELLKRASRRIFHHLGTQPASNLAASQDTWFWYAPLRLADYDFLALHDVLAGRRGSEGLRQHLDRANEARSGQVALTSFPSELAKWFATAAVASPGNCAWRALQRTIPADAVISETAILRGAAIIGDAFRTLFNRAEVIGLLSQVGTPGLAYWQQVLEYCLAGNLQAVLDEYLHHLVGNERPTTDEEVERVARGVADAIGFGRGRIQAFDPDEMERPINFAPRFAVRYGNARGTVRSDEDSTDRMSDVRSAFNSPFWPMVLASTSVGQEGIDFHWWCHSLVHWNQPANVVDLEQREGRVHRFRGHAVRKNVAAAHRADALRSPESDPWDAAFAAAGNRRPADMNELWPSWVYPGAATVRCWVPYFPLSKEIDRAERLRRDRALYRLAFGQPRQEDLIGILDADGVAADPDHLRSLRIDLTPPPVADPPNRSEDVPDPIQEARR